MSTDKNPPTPNLRQTLVTFLPLPSEGRGSEGEGSVTFRVTGQGWREEAVLLPDSGCRAVSLTPRFSGVLDGRWRSKNVSTVSRVSGKPLKRYAAPRQRRAPRLSGVLMRRIDGHILVIPKTVEPGGGLSDSAVPSGLVRLGPADPTLKRWAIVGCASGTRVRFLLMRISLWRHKAGVPCQLLAKVDRILLMGCQFLHGRRRQCAPPCVIRCFGPKSLDFFRGIFACRTYQARPELPNSSD